MNEETPKRTPWRFAPRSILTGSGLLSGLGAAIGLLDDADARRGNKARNQDRGNRKDDDRRNRKDEDAKEEKQRNGNNDKNDKNDGGKNNDKNDGGKNDGGGNRKKNNNDKDDDNGDRKNDRGSNDRADERQAQKADKSDNKRGHDDDGGSRREQRRNARQDDDSDDSSNDTADSDHSFYTYGSPATLYQPVDIAQTVPTTTSIDPGDFVPDISNADLVVEGNPEVIAGVSGRGGFAFARSGDVTAFTGPDGATIIQSPPVGTSPPPPPPTTTDGGDNNTDFSS